MASNITLTSSMRSNLSSLKSLACQMSTTQTRLSTGKRVNSAIDNANSYYQSRALTNRSSDLDMLLDAMGQSIQTIQAAVKGLEASGEVLEQATVIAQNAYESEKTIAVPAAKEYFEELVGPNGAVVTSAQELKDAVNSGKEIVCVYGKIDYFNNQYLTLQANQKLVGTEYFTGYTGNKKFSEINFQGTQARAILAADNTLISDLSLNFDSRNNNTDYVIEASGNITTNLRNLDIFNKAVVTSNASTINNVIDAVSGGKIYIGGVVNINIDSTIVRAMCSWGNGSNITVLRDAEVNVMKTNTNTDILLYGKASIDIYGKLNMAVGLSMGNTTYVSQYRNNSLNIHESAEITIKRSAAISRYRYNNLNIDAGAKFNLMDSDGVATAFVSKGYDVDSDAASISLNITNMRDNDHFNEVASDIDWGSWSALPQRSDAEEPTRVIYDREQFDEILTTYDELISDAGYQGINLLAGGKMDVMFNENRTHSYTVQGNDMSSSGIGITAREWRTKDDIAASIKEIKNAMNNIRDEVTRLGNSLSIIQTRMDFTDAMTDILQIGADDLVLADMNEESANYLALQTRNNLAVNALALAAQSNNSVLKLF